MVNMQISLALLVSLVAFGEEAIGFLTLPLKTKQVDPSAVRNVFGRAARAEVVGTNVPATDYIRHNTDLQWYVPISVGNPPQTMNLILDTGSYDMWVAGAGCTTCGNSKLFEPSKSTTYSDKPGTAFKIGYGTGVDTDPLPGDAQYVPGKWVTDDVGIANFTAKGQQFVLVSSYPPFLDDVPFDGVMGVGRPGYTQTPNQTPWYWSLYDDNNGTHSKISFFYPPGKVDGAEVTIGGVNPRRYTGAINWQILSNRFSSLYTLDQTGVAINGQSFRAKSRDLAILDTGTPFISVNNKTVSALYAQISPKITEIDRGVWGGPCDVVDAVAPTIALTYAGARTPLDLTIPKSAFNLGPYKGSNTTCQTLFLGLDLFGRPDDGYDTWLVGAPLLKQYYTVWDGAYGQIGFANPVFN